MDEFINNDYIIIKKKKKKKPGIFHYSGDVQRYLVLITRIIYIFWK